MVKDEPYTNKFSELSKASILVAGGKGANLGEMTQAGFAVPSGIVVNTGSYDTFVKANNLQDKVLSIASAVLGDNPETSESASEEIRKLFVNVQIPADIEEAIVSSYASLDGENTVVAVRSSATAEDLPGASFAGQQESYLHVQGKDQLLEAVKKCWASLWTARAITYRIKQGIAPEDVSLAAVVQKQINSDISGIAFSLNIQNNYYDEAVINSNFGLGESVVSGQVTPDYFVVNKITKKITEKVINEKQLMLVGKPDGGIEEQKISDPKAPSLTDEQVLEVAKLVTDVETHYKVPMDIEWAIYEGKLYLLQARPITTHLPLFPELLTKPSEKKKVYIDMIVMTQGFSDSMSVLGMDYWANMLKVAKGSSMPRGKDAIVWELHGRQYLNISNMIKIGGIVTKSFSSYDAPTRQILAELEADDEYIPDEIPEPLKGYTWRAIVTALPIVRKMIPALFNVEKAQQEYMKSDAKTWKYLKEDLSRSEETFDVQAKRALDMFGAMTMTPPAPAPTQSQTQAQNPPGDMFDSMNVAPPAAAAQAVPATAPAAAPAARQMISDDLFSGGQPGGMVQPGFGGMMGGMMGGAPQKPQQPQQPQQPQAVGVAGMSGGGFIGAPQTSFSGQMSFQSMSAPTQPQYGQTAPDQYGQFGNGSAVGGGGIGGMQGMPGGPGMGFGAPSMSSGFGGSTVDPPTSPDPFGDLGASIGVSAPKPKPKPKEPEPSGMSMGGMGAGFGRGMVMPGQMNGAHMGGMMMSGQGMSGGQQMQGMFGRQLGMNPQLQQQQMVMMRQQQMMAQQQGMQGMQGMQPGMQPPQQQQPGGYAQSNQAGGYAQSNPFANM